MRYWTVEQARDYLPRLRQLLGVIREAAGVVAAASGNGHGRPGAAVGVQEALEELQAGDIVLRDPQAGIIDFHAQGADGVAYFLCWRDPEDNLSWWHLPEEGFAGRKPLPRDPE
jgi:hypothetical protein